MISVNPPKNCRPISLFRKMPPLFGVKMMDSPNSMIGAISWLVPMQLWGTQCCGRQQGSL